MPTTGEWVEVDKVGIPCPVCGKPDYCRIHTDGRNVHCMRMKGGRSWTGRNGGGWVYNLNKKIAVERVNLKTVQREEVDWEGKAFQFYTSLAGEEMRCRLSEEWGVVKSALVRMRVGGYFDMTDRRLIATFPERNYKGKVIGIVRRFPDGGKRSMRGGQRGLTWPTNLKGDTVFLPEGASDVAALLSHGYSAIGRPSSSGGWEEVRQCIGSFQRPIRVVVLGENDQRPCTDPRCTNCSYCWPGRFHARGLFKKLGKYFPTPGAVSFVMPVIGKDVREWLSKDAASFRDRLDHLPAGAL